MPNSNQYANATLKIIAGLAILCAAAAYFGNIAIAITLSIAIAVICIGVLWERRTPTDQ